MGAGRATRLSALHTGSVSLLLGLAALHGQRAEPARVLPQGEEGTTQGSAQPAHCSCTFSCLCRSSDFSPGLGLRAPDAARLFIVGSSGCPGCCVNPGSRRPESWELLLHCLCCHCLYRHLCSARASPLHGGAQLNKGPRGSLAPLQ